MKTLLAAFFPKKKEKTFLSTLSLQKQNFLYLVFSPCVYFNKSNLVFYFVNLYGRQRRISGYIFLQVFTSTHVGISPALVRVQNLQLLWIFCDKANKFSCRDIFSIGLPQDPERVWCHHCPDRPTKNGKHAKMWNTHAQMSAPDQDFSPALMFFYVAGFFFLWRHKHLLLSAKVISAGFEQQQHSSFLIRGSSLRILVITSSCMKICVRCGKKQTNKHLHVVTLMSANLRLLSYMCSL